jgi:glycosyltransferase involved in cell wall biosynthesis
VEKSSPIKAVAGTIVAQNYLAQASVLADSFYKAHPDGVFTTLIIDRAAGRIPPTNLVGNVVAIDDLPIGAETLYEMVASYTVMELATALKPAFLKYLLATHTTAAIYLDPDIFIYSPLDQIFEALDSSPIVLTPHATKPIPRDGLETSEQTIRHAGIFNLGFIGVNCQADQFLDWWHERLVTDAVVDLSRGLFTDQRWVDFVPSLFEFRVLNDPGLNVAYWNLHERSLDISKTGDITSNHSILKFMHFSGFDPETPWILTKHTPDRARFTIGDSTIARILCDEYAHRLVSAGHTRRKKDPYGYDKTSTGLPLTPLVRSAYRRALTESMAQASLPKPPNPITQPRQFEEWLTTPTLGLLGYRHSRIEREIWNSRSDFQQRFPDIDCEHSPHFLKWLQTDRDVQEIRRCFGIGSQKQPTVQPLKNGGWNVVGYFSAELGVGEAGRQLGRLVALSGRPVGYVAASVESSRQQHEFEHELLDQPRYRNSILAVNADQTKRVLELSAITQHPRGRRIGFWFWEVEDFPKRWRSAFSALDEVWCASEFVERSLLSANPSCPIRRVRLPLEAPIEPTPYSRDLLGLPDGFVFLFTFDFNSVMKRKNPLGAVDAYCRAFGPNEGAHLVLKSINGHRNLSEMAELTYRIHNRPDIQLLDGYLSAGEVQGQIELCDSFVSLHRSEGYGLNLARAMMASKPVIATGYSGNLDFMPAAYPFLVNWNEVAIGSDAYPYGPTSHWADPDLDHAAELMRQVFEDREASVAHARQYAAILQESHSLGSSVERVSDLLEAFER